MDSQNTADILSMDSKRFWLYWKLDNAHVEQLQLGLADEQEALVKWPVPVTFSPSQITILRVPESDVEIRYNLSFTSVFFSTYAKPFFPFTNLCQSLSTVIFYYIIY